MIKAKNIVKCFEDVKALDNLSINVKKGSVYGLVGPNGAGKTTLIKTLLGIYKMDSGELEIGGVQDVNNEELKVDMQSVIDLGYPGPISDAKLNALVEQGLVKETVKDGVITFERTTSAPLKAADNKLDWYKNRLNKD